MAEFKCPSPKKKLLEKETIRILRERAGVIPTLGHKKQPLDMATKNDHKSAFDLPFLAFEVSVRLIRF